MKSKIAKQGLKRQVAMVIAGYEKLLLAFSGGLDSTVLLDLLTSLRDATHVASVLSLRAVHVHHGLSPQADQWVRKCEEQCGRLAVPFSMSKITFNVVSEGIEASARRARYQALEKELMPDEALVTAHHQDDQAETLLLALKRGSGPAGLAAMPITTVFDEYRLLRPLLSCSRSSLVAYAMERGLTWISDESNGDDRFDRNFLRLHVFPLLQQRWPQFSHAVSRSAQLCAEQEALLDELLSETLTTLILPDGALRFSPLLSMSAPRRRALIRRWFGLQGARMPSRKQLVAIWEEVVFSRRDASPKLLLGNRLLCRFRDQLYLLPENIKAVPMLDWLRWPASVSYLLLPQGLGVLIRELIGGRSFELEGDLKDKKTVVSVIRAPFPDEEVLVRFGGVSGLLHISGRRHGRKLKKLWQELAVPPWQRSRTPLLFYNQTLIAVLGMFVTKEGVPSDNVVKWRLYWVQSLSGPDSSFTSEGE